MRQITAEELQEILRKHSLWLNDEEGGERADLYGVDLTSAYLADANLNCADMYGADLTDANLNCADMYGANLRDANLVSAKLTGADIRSANLVDANLTDANLRGADLRGAILTGANLRDANLWNTTGDSVRIHTMQLPAYTVTILDGEIMQIGCQRHTVEEWYSFDDDTISKMSHCALEWWSENKEILQLYVTSIKK